MEKVLLVILSQTRGHNLCFESFEKNVLKEFPDADLALCVTDKDDRSEDNQFYKRAKYVWAYPEADDWRGDYASLIGKYGIIPDWDKFLVKKGNWLGGIKDESGNQTGSGGILLFMRLFLLECLANNNLIEQYDRFIITRSDYIWTCPHPSLDLLASDYIWIPNGESYGGVTDRHICVSRRDIAAVLSPLLYVFKEKPELFHEMSDDYFWNIESFLFFVYKDQGLANRMRFFPYGMFLVKKDDTQTRWSNGFHSIIHDYFIKYPNEYKTALVWRWLVKCQKDWLNYRAFFTSEVKDFPENTPLKNRIAYKMFDKVIKRTYGNYFVTSALRKIKFAFR